MLKYFTIYLTVFLFAGCADNIIIDNFWLEGDLRITPNKQLDLLKKLYDNSLPFSKENQETVKDIIILERNNEFTLRGKTGSVTRMTGDFYINWFIGYIESSGNVSFFATNLEKNKSDMQFDCAKRITIDILKKLEIISSP